MEINTKTDLMAEKILRYLIAHPRSTRIEIEMEFGITFRKFEECRDILGKQIVSERKNKIYYFSAAVMERW